MTDLVQPTLERAQCPADKVEATSSSSTPELVVADKNIKQYIVPREGMLQKIDKQVQQNASNPNSTVLSQVVVLTGRAGAGKAEIVRTYVHRSQQKKRFTNIVWITAGHYWQAANCFLQIASCLRISFTDFKKRPKPLFHIVKEVYDFISQNPSLIIFENAPRLNKRGNEWGIKSFLPKSLARGWVKPVILVTSANPDWKPLKSIIPIPEFTDEECCELVCAELGMCYAESTQKQAHHLCRCFQGLPLAIHQALTFVKSEPESPHKLDSFLQSQKEFHNQSLEGEEDIDIERSVYIVLKITLDKLLGLELGKVAIAWIETMSLLNPDAIPKDLLIGVLPTTEREPACEVIELLLRYNLITDCGDDWKIHRVTQSVINCYLKSAHVEVLMGKSLSQETRIQTLLQRLKLHHSSISDLDSHLSAIVENVLHSYDVSKTCTISASFLSLFEDIAKQLSLSSSYYLSYVLQPEVLLVLANLCQERDVASPLKGSNVLDDHAQSSFAQSHHHQSESQISYRR